MTGFIEMEMSWGLTWDEIQRLKPYGSSVIVPAQMTNLRRNECLAWLLNPAAQARILEDTDRSHVAAYSSLLTTMRLMGELAGVSLMGYMTVVEITYDRTGFMLLTMLHPTALQQADAIAKSVDGITPAS